MAARLARRGCGTRAPAARHPGAPRAREVSMTEHARPTCAHPAELDGACAAPSSSPRRGPAHGPNPRVGCVLLGPTARSSARAGTAARARRTPRSRPCADAADARASTPRGATAVVTLEPCNHTGRTGPCSEALLAAGRRAASSCRVADPNPVAAGGARPAARRRGRRGDRRARRRGARAARRLAAVGRARPPVRHAEARDVASTAGSPPPTAPAAGSPRRSRGTTRTTCGPRSTPSSSAPGPCWSTTRR